MSEQSTISSKQSFKSPRPRKLDAFDSLIGLEEAKNEVQDFFDIAIAAIKDPKSIKRYRLKPAKGLLLYGPPGTGKTAFARACAGYYGLKFGSVKGSEFLAGCSFVGEIEAKLKSMFDKARQHAPCIIFFDEVDAIGQRRTGNNINTPSSLVINNLLAEIDGYKTTSGIFIIAATNRSEILDPALLRPGRLEKQIEIPLPSLKQRMQIFKVYLAGRPCETIRLEVVGEMTEKCSGAFIESCVNRAAIIAWRQRRKIRQNDLIQTIASLQSSVAV